MANTNLGPNPCPLAENLAICGYWMPCTKKLPPLEEEVICLLSGGKFVRVLSRIGIGSGKGFEWSDYDNPELDKDAVTHWMPLPGSIKKS